MSRWTKSFQQHPFQAVWKRFLEQLATTKIDDVTIATASEELHRLKMATAYIQEMIEGVDPELVPRATWDNFQPQADAALSQINTYQSDRNISRIASANDHIDNILSYIKPYYVIPARMARPLQASIKAIKSEMNELISNVRTEAADILVALRSSKQEIDINAEKIRLIAEKAQAFEDEVFVGNDEYISTEAALDDARKRAETIKSAIEAFYAETIADENSTKTRLQHFETLIRETQASLEEVHRVAAEKTEKLSEFHTSIFGGTGPDGTHDETGLENELDARLAHLLAVETQQEKKYHSMFAKIESLLPAANSAGLASAYGRLADKFSTPIETYTKAFYTSLVLLLLIALVTSVEQVNFYPEAAIEFVKLSDWNVTVRAFLYKIPFVAPLIWLAMFSSARRSQYERLQQEYLHKEALARSYESYKKELIDLDTGSEEMLKALIGKAIDTISYNASITLDGKHVESTPATKILDKIKIEDFEKIMDYIRKSPKE